MEIRLGRKVAFAAVSLCLMSQTGWADEEPGTEEVTEPNWIPSINVGFDIYEYEVDTAIVDRATVPADPGTSPGSALLVDVDVNCPGAGGAFEEILALDKTTWGWTTPVEYELRQGDLLTVSTYPGATSADSGNFFNSVPLPTSAQGFYYLVREVGPFCNDVGTWGSNECVLSDAAAKWYPAPGTVPGTGDPTCDRDVDIP